MAALEPQQNEDEESQVSVMLEHSYNIYTLCTLQHGGIFQQKLDLYFNVGEEVTIYLSGRGTVHLTGYRLVDGNMESCFGCDDMELPLERSDGEYLLEEIDGSSIVSGKRKRKGKVDSGSKKRKLENKSEGESCLVENMKEEIRKLNTQVEDLLKKAEDSKTQVEDLLKKAEDSKTQVEDLQKKVQFLQNSAEVHELQTGNLILREAIMVVNHELAVKIFGKKAKMGYTTLDDVEKHAQETKDPVLRKEYLDKLEKIKADVGWTSDFEDTKKKIKSHFKLNTWAHPTIDSDSLQWAKSKFEAAACPERTKLVQDLFNT